MKTGKKNSDTDNMNPEWFENWFDSKYYHILYGDRDSSEAELFMSNLVSYLNPPPGSKIHDLACGKGRHSVFLNKKGFEVTGTDLSSESISYARQFENAGLSFFESDMRQGIRVNYFDYVFNLFTSFGYFESPKDNEAVVKGVFDSLKKNGVFVLDYMNSEKVCKTMREESSKEAGGILFRIKKHLFSGCFVKDISFRDAGKEFLFQERVKAFSRADFEKLFTLAGFEILDCKGSYKLEPFDEQKSDRLILIARKK